MAAASQIELVSHLGFNEQSAERALLVADLAEPALRRAGNDPALRVHLLRFRGDAYYNSGKFAEAKAAFIAARDLAAEQFGPGDIEVLLTVTRLAGVANAMGDNAESKRLAEENLTAMTALLGPDHPAVAALLNELGATSYSLDDYDGAIDYYTRALAITERAIGKDSLVAAILLNNIGGIELGRGHLDAAEAMLGHALAIREAALGPDDPYVAQVLNNLTMVYEETGRRELALELQRRALAIYTKAFGADDPRVAFPLEGIGINLAETGHLEDGLGYITRALDVRTRGLGADHPLTLAAVTEVAWLLGKLHRCTDARALLAPAIPAMEQVGADASSAIEVRGECELVRHQVKAALDSAQRSIEACARTGTTNIDCTSKYWLLARALDASGRRAEAVAAARTVEQRAVDLGAAPRVDLEAVRAWIAARAK